MKFEVENEEEAKNILQQLDVFTEELVKKFKIPESEIPILNEYMNEELLELHYCRKGTRMHLKTNDPETKMIMYADIIGHLLSGLPEDKRNDVLLLAIDTAGLDDMAGTIKH